MSINKKTASLFYLVTLSLMMSLASFPSYAKGGTVEGDIQVFKRGLLGTKEKSDKSGVLVYITGFSRSTKQNILELTQKNKTFKPSILPIVKGQKVRFPNKDNIYHNVFSVSSITSFDLGQYKRGDEPEELIFNKTGLIPVFCNIHPQMIAYIVVLENDAFDQTDKQGKFKIKNVPSGSYTLNAWVNGAKRVSQSIKVTSGQTTQASLRINQVLREKPHKRKDNTDYPKSTEYVGD